MKNLKAIVANTSLVLLPPLIGSTAYFASFKDGFQDFLSNFLYIASASILWWLFSLSWKRRTFIAGLLGIHTMMSWFLFSMRMGWGDNLGWILYLPDMLIGCLGVVIISSIAQKADWCLRRIRIPNSAQKGRF
jgi:hypothetical protein